MLQRIRDIQDPEVDITFERITSGEKEEHSVSYGCSSFFSTLFRRIMEEPIIIEYKYKLSQRLMIKKHNVAGRVIAVSHNGDINTYLMKVVVGKNIQLSLIPEDDLDLVPWEKSKEIEGGESEERGDNVSS
jgi:hypothetical protein